MFDLSVGYGLPEILLELIRSSTSAHINTCSRLPELPDSAAKHLTESVQFAMNVSPDLVAPGISPFQLVSGRRPRLSGKDITFPSKVLPSQTLHGDAKPYFNDLCARLQDFRLAALERQLERKEHMRDRHDKKRSAKRLLNISRGDLVHRFSKTSHPKLQYQWSNPVWLVIKVGSSTCTLKPLVSPQGR